jgi:hypothetical protein
MKQNFAICLLLAGAVNGLKLKDIFDAYDTESALEQTKTNED